MTLISFREEGNPRTSYISLFRYSKEKRVSGIDIAIGKDIFGARWNRPNNIPVIFFRLRKTY